MRVAKQRIVLEIEQAVVVDSIRGFVQGFVEDERVDRGLTSQNNIVTGDFLCRKFLDAG